MTPGGNPVCSVCGRAWGCICTPRLNGHELTDDEAHLAKEYIDYITRPAPVPVVDAEGGVMTPTLRAMPNQPRTPHRTIRVSDELWAAAQEAAADKGETLSDVLRRSLERYVKAAKRGK